VTRLSPPVGPPLGEPEALTHQALIYSSDEEFLAAAIPFCQGGLAHGAALLVLAGAATTALLRPALRDVGPVDFIPAEEWYATPGGALGAAHQYVDECAAENGHREIRVLGEPVWQGRDAVETAEWTRYEAAINLAFAPYPAWLLCAYDARGLPAPVVADARRSHPALCEGTSARTSPDYAEPADRHGAWNHRLLPLPADDKTAVLDFRADLGGVRDFAATAARGYGASPDDVDRLVFSVNEVATNALQHGGEGRLTMRCGGRRLVCDITNPSDRGTDWFLGYRPPRPDQERGYGLWTVRQLCHLVQIDTHDGHTTVRLHLNLTLGP
jgi:anti-sigma regulatory factor (Ser/Thr protein kinase)